MAVPQIGSFEEVTAGEIIAPNGQTVVKVMVENMTTSEASRMVRTICDALGAEFLKEDPATVVWKSQHPSAPHIIAKGHQALPSDRPIPSPPRGGSSSGK